MNPNEMTLPDLIAVYREGAIKARETMEKARPHRDTSLQASLNFVTAREELSDFQARLEQLESMYATVVNSLPDLERYLRET